MRRTIIRHDNKFAVLIGTEIERFQFITVPQPIDNRSRQVADADRALSHAVENRP